MQTLASAARQMADWMHSDTRFTRHRGDGWQIYLAQPGLALRGCLFLTASLKASRLGLATRISVGVGAVDRLGAAGLSEASGDAFTFSGQGLDAMPGSKRLVIGSSEGATLSHHGTRPFSIWSSGNPVVGRGSRLRQ